MWDNLHDTHDPHDTHNDTHYTQPHGTIHMIHMIQMMIHMIHKINSHMEQYTWYKWWYIWYTWYRAIWNNPGHLCLEVCAGPLIKKQFATSYIGLARTIYIRCKYGIFGRKSTKYKVTYGVYGPVLANPRCDPWGWPLPDQGLSATHTKHTPAHTLGTQSVPFTL